MDNSKLNNDKIWENGIETGVWEVIDVEISTETQGKYNTKSIYKLILQDNEGNIETLKTNAQEYYTYKQKLEEDWTIFFFIVLVFVNLTIRRSSRFT